MKTTFKILALILFGLLLFGLSIKLVLNKQVFDGLCVYVSAVVSVFLAADYSTKK